MNKKILSAVLALAVSAVFCGCTENLADDTASAAETTTVVTEQVEETVELETTAEETTSEQTITEKKTPAETEAPVLTEPAEEKADNLHVLTTYNRFLSVDEESDGFYFEVQLSKEEAESGVEVALYDEDGNKVADMLDDGGHDPDRIAGDGLYCCFYMPEVYETGIFDYTAKIGDAETNVSRVCIYDDLSDDDFNEVRELCDRIEDIKSKYTDLTGAVSDDKKDEAMDELETFVKELYDEREIVDYNVSRESGSIMIKHKSCIPIVVSIEDDM